MLARETETVILHTDMALRVFSHHAIFPTQDTVLSLTFRFDPQLELIKCNLERMHFRIIECEC